MAGVAAIGFSGYLGDLRLVTGCFMGFWVGRVSVGPPQGVSWVFEGYGVLLRGLIKGFSDGLCCFSDFSESCNFTKILLLLFIVAF